MLKPLQTFSIGVFPTMTCSALRGGISVALMPSLPDRAMEAHDPCRHPHGACLLDHRAEADGSMVNKAYTPPTTTATRLKRIHVLPDPTDAEGRFITNLTESRQTQGVRECQER